MECGGGLRGRQPCVSPGRWADQSFSKRSFLLRVLAPPPPISMATSMSRGRKKTEQECVTRRPRTVHSLPLHSSRGALLWGQPQSEAGWAAAQRRGPLGCARRRAAFRPWGDRPLAFQRCCPPSILSAIPLLVLIKPSSHLCVQFVCFYTCIFNLDLMFVFSSVLGGEKYFNKK